MTQRMVREKSLYRRLMIAASAAVAVVTFASLVLAWLGVRSSSENAFEARLKQTATGLLGSLARGSDGTLSLEDGAADQPEFLRPRSGWYWQAEQNGVVVLRSRSLGSDTLPFGEGTLSTLALHGEPLIVVTTAPRVPESFRIKVSGPRSTLDSGVVAEMKPIAAILGTLFLFLLVAVHLVIRQALKPLDVMVISISALQAGGASKLPITGIREVDQATGAINSLLDETRSLVTANRGAAAKLAHALKTPLAQMSAHAGKADSATATRIQNAVDAMRRQIDLQLSRLRQSRLGEGGRRDWTEVEPIIADLVFAFERREVDRGIKAGIACDDRFSVPVERTDLEELLGNLLDNAFRHAAQRVAVTASQDGKKREIVIMDDGIGISPSIVEQLAHRSDRADASIQAGLGLALAHDIILRSGGSLSIDKEVDGGARIRLLWK
jgi:signal transduction histidine kinase